MNRSLLWLGAALLTWGMGEGMFLMFQTIYLQQLHADPIQIGAILGTLGLVMALSHIPAGHLSDRIGQRPMLITAWLIGVLAAALMAAAKGLPVFIAGLLLYGFTAFLISPLESYVTAMRGAWSVGRALTFMFMIFSAGAVIGPLIGGWIGDHFGLQSVYFLSTGIFSISTILIWFIAPVPAQSEERMRTPGIVLKDWHYLGFITIYFVVIFAAYLPQPFTANFLNSQRHFSLTVIGELDSIAGIGSTVLSFLLGRLEARLGFLIGQICMALFALLLWQGAGFGLFAMGYFLLGGYQVLRSLGVAQVRPLIHESQMGLAYGATEMARSSAVLLAPPLAGYVYSIDPALVYPVSLGAIGLGLLISLLLIRHAPERGA